WPRTTAASGCGHGAGCARAVSAECAESHSRSLSGAEGYRVSIFSRTVAELAAGLRAKEFSSVELAKLYLDRIEASQSALNAFISVTREHALAAAADADRALAAGRAGPLTGVPIAHKDIFCTQG